METEQHQEEIKDECGEEATKESKIYRTPLFTKIYATNVKVFPTDVDIRVELLNEKRETEDETIFYSDGLVMLTPEAAKKLSLELNITIENYENEKGEIKIKECRKDNVFVD